MQGMNENSAVKKRVVFVLSGYGRVQRGAERFVENLAVRLANRLEVVVLGSGTEAPCAVPLNFPTRDARWAVAANRCPGLGHFLRLFQLDPLNWEWLFCARAAQRWLLKNPCDLLVVEGGRWGGRLGRWAHQRFGIPVVDVAHGAPSRWETAAARAHPQTYVSLTQTMASVMQRQVPDLRVAVIPMGIDLHRFSPEGPRQALALERPITLAVGALEPLKRMGCLVEAVQRRGRGSLVILGRGPMERELAAQGKARLGAGRFLMASATQEELPAWYRAADVLALASISESFGLVYVEALACGLPVVTRGDELRREVLGDAATLLPAEIPSDAARDADAFAEGITQALTTAETTRPQRQRRVQEYDVERMANRYERLFCDLMAEFSQRSSAPFP